MASSIASLGESVGVVRRVWSRVRRPLIVTVVCLATIVAVVALSRTTLFHVRTIHVRGTVTLTSERVLRLAGLSERDNALWLDRDTAEAMLMGDPRVARADVHIDLPWTVVVTVTERSPIAVLRRGAERVLVAGDGTILGPGRAPDLPVIEAPPAWVDPDAGTALRDAAAALEALRPELRQRVSRAVLGGDRGLELQLTDGIHVVVGPAGSYREKARVLEEVLAWIERTNGSVRSIDVSAPSAPAVVPAR